MRNLLFLYCLLSPFTYAASSIVDIEIKIGQRSDDEVRAEAKRQAHVQGTIELPQIISSQESLSNGRYRQEISALLLGQVDVLVQEEKWLRDQDTYQLKAEVTLDDEASLQLIRKYKIAVTENKSLKKIYESVLKHMGKPGYQLSDFEMAKLSADDLRSALLTSHSLDDYLKAKENALSRAKLEYLYEVIYKAYETLEIEFIDANEDSMSLRLNLPKGIVRPERWLQQEKYMKFNLPQYANEFKMNLCVHGSIKHSAKLTLARNKNSAKFELSFLSDDYYRYPWKAKELLRVCVA